MHHPVVCAVLLCFMLMAAPASAQPSRVDYRVDLTAPHTQTVTIEMTIHGVDLPALEVCLPVWRPGLYLILDPAGTVRTFRAVDGRGNTLPSRKTDKACWIIDTQGQPDITVRYEVYANSLGDRTRHVDDTHAFLNPSTVFIYSPAYRALPVRVELDIPGSWNVSSGMRSEGSARTLVAPNYDLLVDSPIEAGQHDTFLFEVDGVRHEIMTWWAGGLNAPLRAAAGTMYDSARLTEDVAKIVREQKTVFGDLPYERYVFMTHVYPGGRGGTEHWNSTIMQTSPATFETEDAYKRFLALVSHEMFHTWNVKRLRPAGLRPYDYQKENYTDLLWVAEGTTSYYDDLTLARTGLKKTDAYLETLSNSITALRNRPGAKLQSLEESSFDAWVKFNKRSEDAVNSQVSFYDKGALVSFLLDLELRARTGNAASLDTLMRELYQRFPETGPGFTRADIESAASKLALGPMPEFFDRYVSGADDLPFEAAVGMVGLELIEKKPAAKDQGEDDKDKDKDKEKTPAHTGLEIDWAAATPRLSAVRTDGPAVAAGFLVNDQILAINGLRATPGLWDRTLKETPAGQRVRISIFRHDTLREIELPITESTLKSWKLQRVKEPTDAQKAAYTSWIRQPWPGN